MPNRKNEPERVGEVLDSAFLKVHGINQTALGEALGFIEIMLLGLLKGLKGYLLRWLSAYQRYLTLSLITG